jgi:hypothetical protein
VPSSVGLSAEAGQEAGWQEIGSIGAGRPAVTTERDRAQPGNLAILPASCSQPETTTTTAPAPVETTTTTDPPATTTTAPPARAATPVPAQPNFTG